MPKPIQIAGLLRRTPIARAAANVLRAVLLYLLEKVPEARSGDSKKGIHDLRVAVKRFREAFRLFQPVLRKKTFRKHREWIEDLNDALGEVRDRDVALLQLRKLTAGLAEPPRSLADLPARLESERLGAARDGDAMAVMLEPAMAGAPKAERRAWEGLSVRGIRGRRVALRKAFSLADELEPLWDEAQRAVGGPPH